MRNLKRSLYLLPAMLLALACYQPTPAQDAPANADPFYFTPDQLNLWEAWIHGDLKQAYSIAQQMLENGDIGEQSFETVLALQTEAAEGLGWHEAHARDLKALIGIYADAAGEYKYDQLRWELMRCLKHAGRIDEIAPQVSALGMLTNWQVCGPFSNDRGQGFEDEQEPEENFKLDAEYEGKEGQPVGFRKLPAKPLAGTLDLGAMLRPNHEATAFLVTAVWCAEAGEANLLVGSTEDVKVWLGGRIVTDTDGEPVDADSALGLPVLEDREERPVGMGQSVARVSLRQGWNVLIVKSGNSETDWKFNARIRSDVKWREGSDEELQQACAGIEQYKVGPDGDPDEDALSPGTEAQFWGVCQEMLRPRMDRASTQPRRDMDAVLEDLRELTAEASDTELPTYNREYALVCYVAAWANRSSARYTAGREENRRRELLMQCLELDPKAARAALELSQYYTTTFGNPALADDYAKQAVTANPDWIEARIYASRVVLMKGLDIEVERELAKLLQEHPEDANVLRYSAYYAGLRRDYKLSNDLFEKALAADFADDYSRARLLERATARGDMKTALKLATDARKLDPFDTSPAVEMADMYMNSEKYSLAERELNKALEIAPRDDGLLEKLGQVYSAWSDISEGDKAAEFRAKALAAYNDALDANPKREDIERYLEFLEGEQPPFEAALQEDVTDRISAALKEEVTGDDPYEVIYRDEIVLVNADGTTSQYIQQVYRVLNDNGRDWLQQLTVPAYSDQQGRCVEARVYRSNGDVEEGRRSRWAASFPPLDIGDVVQVRFRVTDSSQSFFGDFYGERKTFADYVPVREVRYAWVFPEGRTYHEYRTGAAPERVERTVNGRQVWSYRATNLSKLYDEPLAPPIEQRSPTVQLSTYGTWKEFGRWYYNLIRKQLEPTPEMTAKVNELTKGLTTEKEKARAIYDWVVTEVRYNADWHFGVHGYKPFSAGAVFARCIGDCKDKAILICTMLRIAGVKASPVITNLENFRGNEDITLPMPNHFNHAIAHVEYADGTSQFVDGTATYNGIDELPGADHGANCIIVRPEGGERTQIPWGEPEGDLETDDIDAEFAPGGTLTLTVKRTAVGDSASSLRARYEQEGDRKKQLEQEWSRYYPGAKVSDIEGNDLSDIELQPEITFKVELPNAYATKDGHIEFRLGLDPREWTQTSFASLTTRKTDLLTPAPFQRRSTVRFKLPAGYKATLPAALAAEGPHAKLSVSASTKDGTLTVTREYSLLGGTVTTAEYPEFRRKLIQFDTAEAATIKLTK